MSHLKFTQKALLAIGLCVIVGLMINMGNPSSEPPAGESPPTPDRPDSITIIGVGDMMLGTNYPSVRYLPPNDGRDLLKPMWGVLRQADITFGNLEGVLLDKAGQVKSCKDPSKCYAFRMPERYVNHLVEAGFDMVSVANNHMGDFGETGRINTLKVLEKASIHHAGLLSRPTAIVEQNGITYGLCAFSPNTGTCDIRKIQEAGDIVAELDRQCDIVIVSFHGGAEGSSHQRVPRRTETFYGENRGNVYEFAHRMIDAGADIIFGHGPHVTRAIDLYKDRFITYSLGNFCTYARFSLKGPNGIAPVIKLWTDKQGAFLKGEIIPVFQEDEGGPQPDSLKRAIHLIRDLTAKDFPELDINITENGLILKN